MYIFSILFVICVFFSIGLIWSKFNLALKSFLIISLILGSLLSFYIVDGYLGHEKEVYSLPAKLLVHGFTLDREKTNILCSINGELLHLSFATDKQIQKALNNGRKEHGGEPFELELEGEGEAKKNKGNKAPYQSISLDSITDAKHSLPKPNMPKK